MRLSVTTYVIKTSLDAHFKKNLPKSLDTGGHVTRTDFQLHKKLHTHDQETQRQQHGAGRDNCRHYSRSSRCCGPGSCVSGIHRLHLSWDSCRLHGCHHDVVCCSHRRRRSGSRKSGGCSAISRCCWSVVGCHWSCGRHRSSSGRADAPHQQIILDGKAR